MKECKECKTTKPLTEFYRRSREGSYEAKCKSCQFIKRTGIERGSRLAKIERARELEKQGLRFCPRCETTHSLELFGQKGSSYQAYCKPCMQDYRRQVANGTIKPKPKPTANPEHEAWRKILRIISP